MAESLIGRSLLNGEYQLTGILGRGGMATVYRAHSRSLETDVAVKVLAPRLATDPGFRERHHDEARSLAQLHHPNLVEVHHYGEEGDLVYIVMRMVHGGTLKNRLACLGGPLGLLPAARLISQVADALQLAHDRGLVHLDIKPANILLGRSDWPLLADFGITRAIETLESSRGNVRMAGTPLYMSPEQCRGGSVDGRSDQYSLAITTFELLTGRQPFHAETTEALLQRQIADPPPRPREVNPGIPGPVEDVLLRALAKSPEDRYPTVREFAAALTSAAERTRGVSLETKAAVAGAAPNLLAVFALLLLGPILFAMLPVSAFLGQRVPLTWPFQLILSVLVAVLLLGIRWHLIGLLTRGLDVLLDTVLSFGSSSDAPGAGPRGPLEIKSWRTAALGSVEGAVNLMYLVALYRLVAVPFLAISTATIAGTVNQIIVTAVTVVFVALAVGIVVAVYRSGGAVATGVILGVCWVFASALPTVDVATTAGFSLAWAIRAFVGAGAFAILLATRRRAQVFIQRLAEASLGRLVAESRPGASPDEIGIARRRLSATVGGIVDFFYLLIGYALLRSPLLDVLQRVTGMLPAVILVSGVAALVWFLLMLRIQALAGGAGLTLGLLLGAPLLISLPFLDSSVFGSSWPAAVAVWIVGIAFVLVLVAIRGQIQSVGQKALGPSMDRGLLGTRTASTEEQSNRRSGALGGVVGALLDVSFLVLAYWMLGEPVASAIGRATKQPGVGSIFLGALVLAAIAILLGPVYRALVAVEETGGPRWSSRARALPALAIALVALVVGGCAATPMALAAPEVAGGLTLAAPPASTVIVDWEHWLPWSPTRGEATFDISLSCPDGRQFGQFREVFHPGPGAVMPSGNVGHLGSTNVPCDNWTEVYFAQRRTAGLTSEPSGSLDWLDVRTTINPDGTADVVETHRAMFTNGTFDHLSWSLPSSSDAGEVSNLRIIENGTPYPMNSPRTGDRYARTSTTNGVVTATWWFPPVESPSTVSYVLTYHLSSVVRSSGSGRRFERQVLGPSRLGPNWRMTTEVVLPRAVDPAAIQLGSNDAAIEYGLVNDRTASYTASNVPSNATIDVFVNFPSSSGASNPPAAPNSDTTTTPTPTPNLNGIAGGATTLTPSPRVTATATVMATVTTTSTITLTPTPDFTPTSTPSQTGTPTATASATATLTATSVTTAKPTATSVPPTATTKPAASACVPVPVLAMYYDWYDMKTWSGGTTSDQPVSPYVSTDRATIERQVTQAQSVGIQGFEVNWWGKGNQTDTNMQTLLSVAGGHGFKVTADFDLNSPFVHNAGDLTNELIYLKRYFNDPSWFHYHGKPFVLFFGTSKYDVATWGAIIKKVDPNHQVFWMAEGDNFSYLNVFDGIHPYSVAWSPNPSAQLASYARQVRARPGKTWMATVMPGYNDKLARGANGFSVDRQNGAYYAKMWDGAMATHPDILSITSFNEWVEGSQMEPSKSYGNLYLDLTKQKTIKYHSALTCG